jgi:hypothetical protein
MLRLSRFTLLALMACCVCLLPAAPAAAIDVCGNGICNTTTIPAENATNCPADCGGGPTDCLQDPCEKGDCSEPTTGADKDYDGLSDRVEFHLAHKFFPTTLLQWHDEDRSESYLFRNRATPYTLKPYYQEGTECAGDLACIEIRYGITFFYDHGDMWVLDSGHLGDSEMYAALLRRRPGMDPNDAESWEMIRDFTSAHWGSGSDSSVTGAYSCPLPCDKLSNDPVACNARSTCRATGFCSGWSSCGGFLNQKDCQRSGCNWTPSCVKKFPWECYSGDPLEAQATVFCAESKHALYHTDDECDSGGDLYSDDCPNNQYDMRDWKEGRLQNVGNADYHADNDVTIQQPSQCGSYDVWGGAEFGKATSYLHNFLAPINWGLN